ncbi:MAG: hypothetical protein WC975_04700 [Phycisphaerae bacterium]
MKIIWKEIRQQRLFVVLGVLLGLIWPVIRLITIYINRYQSPILYTSEGSVAVLIGGVFFAVILGIHSTFDDFRPGRDSFWQSKPISPTRLILVKYFVGLMSLLLVFLIVLSIDFITALQNERSYYLPFCWSVLTWTFPVAGMFFALSIFLTVLLREPAKAVFIAVWFGLIFYFSPLLVRWLMPVSIFYAMDNREGFFAFLSNLPPVPLPPNFLSFYDIIRIIWPSALRLTAVPVLITVPALVLSIVGIRRNWQWKPGLPTIVWTFGLSLAGIFTIALTQIGHNLPPLTSLNGKPFDPVVNLNMKPQNFNDLVDNKTPPNFTPFVLGDMDFLNNRFLIQDNLLFNIGTIQNRQEFQKNPEPSPCDMVLNIYRMNSDGKVERLSATRYFSFITVPFYTQNAYLVCIKNNRLYTIYYPTILAKGYDRKHPEKSTTHDMRLAVFEISDLNYPKLISDQDLPIKNDYRHFFPSHGVYKDYLYIFSNEKLSIYRVDDLGKIGLAKEISSYELSLRNRYFQFGNLLLSGDQLYGLSGSYFVVYSLANPLSPKVLFETSFRPSFQRPYSYTTSAMKGEYIYCSHRYGIDVYRFYSLPDGKFRLDLVGSRQATPLEDIAGHGSDQLLIHGNKLIEAAGMFGVLVYDISDPTRIRRINHGGDRMIVRQIGFWKNLFFAAGYTRPGSGLYFLKLPNK